MTSCLLLLTTCLHLLLAGGPSEIASREQLIKAAFLHKFAVFTSWDLPNSQRDETHIQLGIVGENPFGDALNTIEGLIVKGKPLAIRFLTRNDDFTGCHILFIAKSEGEHLETILAHARSSGILTVSDLRNFTRAGGIIQLKTDDRQRINLIVNIDAARDSGLTISSRLLSLATIVSD